MVVGHDVDEAGETEVGGEQDVVEQDEDEAEMAHQGRLGHEEVLSEALSGHLDDLAERADRSELGHRPEELVGPRGVDVDDAVEGVRPRVGLDPGQE